MTFLASIPSPPSPLVFHAGALAPRWYGLLIAIGMMVAITVTRREFRRRGLPYELVFNLALWTIPAAVLGARAYHVITDWRLFSDDPIRVLAISSGGLGLPGALIGGAIGLLLATRRFGLPMREVLDCIAPGLLCAQIIGRFGNYANQELFGRPTSLPWGIEIDPVNRPARFAESPAFHPTFAYEALWNVLVLAFIVRLAGGFRPRRRAGAIFASYLALYSLGRLVIEQLRSDPASQIAGQRVNTWTFLTLLGASLVTLALLARGPSPLSDRAARS